MSSSIQAYFLRFVLVLLLAFNYSFASAQSCLDHASLLLKNAPRFSLGSLGSTDYATVILLGPPAVGKGTLSEELMSTQSFTHISVGAALRENIKAKTPAGLQAEAYMNRGDLVPEDIIRSVLSDTLDRAPKDKPLIFDGSPRKLEEAKFLVEALQKKERTPVLVILLEAKDDVLVARAAARNRGPDDAPDVVKHRLKVYREETVPAVQYLKSLDGRGVTFRVLDGSQSVQMLRKAALEHITR
jgi:adenylate kinase